jgi:hypothetical protein
VKRACEFGSGHGEEQCLDGLAFVHRAVAVGDLVEWEGEVEDLAGVDLVVVDEIDEFG